MCLALLWKCAPLSSIPFWSSSVFLPVCLPPLGLLPPALLQHTHPSLKGNDELPRRLQQGRLNKQGGTQGWNTSQMPQSKPQPEQKHKHILRKMRETSKMCACLLRVFWFYIVLKTRAVFACLCWFKACLYLYLPVFAVSFARACCYGGRVFTCLCLSFETGFF